MPRGSSFCFGGGEEFMNGMSNITEFRNTM